MDSERRGEDGRKTERQKSSEREGKERTAMYSRMYIETLHEGLGGTGSHDMAEWMDSGR